MVLLVAAVALATTVKPLTVKDAKTLVDITPNLYILDVRTPDEYKQARMKDSVQHKPAPATFSHRNPHTLI
jgi:rhodanese-related sulfurtransferase